MIQRIKKLGNLLALREREVGVELRALREAQIEEARTTGLERAAREVLRSAVEARRALGDGPCGAQAYIEAEAWAESASLRHHQTRLAHRRAQNEVARVARRVEAARLRQKQVENLLERLEVQRLADERRRERRSEDEIAQILARRS